jgi:hypothetical protein
MNKNLPGENRSKQLTKQHEEWIKQNFTILNPEEQEIITNYQKNIKYSMFVGFLLGMIPHIKFLSQENIKLTLTAKSITKFFLFIQIPFLTSAFCSAHFTLGLKRYVTSLESKKTPS